MPKFEAIPYRTLRGRDTDAVVFVHGFTGKTLTTWRKFPELLATDPDLPYLDILLFGYKSRWLSFDPDIGHAGDRLVSELELQLDPNASIFLVGHSMGGLVILSGLVQRLRAGHAKQPPCRSVAHITLFATPVMGSQAATVLQHLMLLLRLLPKTFLLRMLESKQMAGMARGTSIDRLLAEVAQRLSHPEITPGDENSKRAIRVRAVVGDEDYIVTESSAEGIFYAPPPIRVSGTHTSVKEPESHRDSRYRALKNDIASTLSPAFHELCRRCLNCDTAAEAVFFDKWEEALNHRLREAFPSQPESSERTHSLAILVWKVGVAHPESLPGSVLDTTVVYFKKELLQAQP